MKKSILSIVIAIVALVSFSFTTPIKDKKEIKLDKSQVVWKGYKVTGSHTGTITLKSGSLVFDQEKLIEGEFLMDMSQIITTDLTGEYKDKLEGHLKSDDFFGVDKNPTATLVFTSVRSTGKNSYEVTGDLTIKGQTNPINFEMSIYGNKATASLKVDRTKYGVKYGSTSFFDDLADKAIYDEFDLVADLEF